MCTFVYNSLLHILKKISVFFFYKWRGNLTDEIVWFLFLSVWDILVLYLLYKPSYMQFPAKLLSSLPNFCTLLQLHRVNRLTPRLSLAEQELLTFSEHLSSPPFFSGIRVTRSLVLYICFVDHCLSFCPFSFGHCVVCSSLILQILITPLVSLNPS